MKLIDQLGNAVSTRNRKALELYDTAVAQLNVFRIDPMATIESALAEDPSFVMAHAFKAGVLLTTSERGAESAIAAALDAAAAHQGHALDRELAHLQGRASVAERRFRRRPPRSMAASPPSIRATCWRCRSRTCAISCSATRRCCATVRRRRCARGAIVKVPSGIVLGMHAFGLEECGHWDSAEIAGRSAIELNPADAWAAHAVAHVMEMSGRTREGIEWLESHRAWLERAELLRVPQLVAHRPLPPGKRRSRFRARRLRHAHPSRSVSCRDGNGGRFRAPVAPAIARRGRRRSMERAGGELADLRRRRLLRLQRRARA